MFWSTLEWGSIGCLVMTFGFVSLQIRWDEWPVCSSPPVSPWKAPLLLTIVSPEITQWHVSERHVTKCWLNVQNALSDTMTLATFSDILDCNLLMDCCSFSTASFIAYFWILCSVSRELQVANDENLIWKMLNGENLPH